MEKSESSLVSVRCGCVSSCQVVFEEVVMLSGITGDVGGGGVLCAPADAPCQLPAPGVVLGDAERVCLPFDEDPSPCPLLNVHEHIRQTRVCTHMR